MKPHIKLWIAGHTHIAMEKIINKTYLCVNPLGYEHECNKATIKSIDFTKL